MSFFLVVCTNNNFEYEALVQGLQKYIRLDVEFLKVFADYDIVINHVRNNIYFLLSHLNHYQCFIQDLIYHLSSFNIAPTPRIHNANADLLANVASKLIAPDDFRPDRFSIELIIFPSILDNITNWRMFNYGSEF